MKTCETCEYWERYGKTTFGNCSLIAKGDASDAQVEFEGSNEFIEYVEDNTLLFSVKETFGCPNHEEKK